MHLKIPAGFVSFSYLDVALKTVNVLLKPKGCVQTKARSV